MTDVPDWAIKEFCTRANLIVERVFNDHSEDAVVLRSAVRAGARIIAEHEKPPVDPLRKEAEDIAWKHASASTAFITSFNRRYGTEVALTALRRGIELAQAGDEK